MSPRQHCPNGYTLVSSPAAPLTHAPFLTKAMPYRTEQVEPVCPKFEKVFSIAVWRDAPIKSLHDLRPADWAALHDPGNYAPSQTLARALRGAGSWGVTYRSVRHAGGECVGVFRPRALKLPVQQDAHVTLQWDGTRITNWFRKSALRAV